MEVLHCTQLTNLDIVSEGLDVDGVIVEKDDINSRQSSIFEGDVDGLIWRRCVWKPVLKIRYLILDGASSQIKRGIVRSWKH